MNIPETLKMPSLSGFGKRPEGILRNQSIHFEKSDWGHSAIFKMATEDLSVLMASSDSRLPLEVFDGKYLVEYPSREIWLSEAEAWLPSDDFKFYTDGSLFEGRAFSGVFSQELDLKASFGLGTFATAFQAADYCLRECMTGKSICISSDSRAALLV
jgi:hypothetical protein